MTRCVGRDAGPVLSWSGVSAAKSTTVTGHPQTQIGSSHARAQDALMQDRQVGEGRRKRGLDLGPSDLRSAGRQRKTERQQQSKQGASHQPALISLVLITQ